MRSRGFTKIEALLAAALGLASVWTYWPDLALLVDRWNTDSRYSHGWLVPVFALYLVWQRRDRFRNEPARPCASGLLLVLTGSILRLAGGYVANDWLSAISLLPCLGGAIVLLKGWGWARIALPSLAFLIFMVPLPYRLEIAMGWPLQRFATDTSTVVLQTLGFPAYSSGNIIQLTGGKIGVVEACSGLSMLLLFIALAAAMTLLNPRSWVENVIVMASAVPIALVANVGRIVLTGALHELVGKQVAHVVYHDLAGWLMMPIGLGLLALEYWILSRSIEVSVEAPGSGDTGSIMASRRLDPDQPSSWARVSTASGTVEIR